MEEKIPYIAHESMMARLERTIKRLWILAIILTVALIATNAAWIYYESQWEVVTTYTQEVTQDTECGGDSQFVGGDYYGQTESQNN